MLLTHLGFKVDFISWIMGCIANVSYAILINGATTPFFKGQRGLRQGCPLSPLLFLLVAEGLSQLIQKAKREGKVRDKLQEIPVNCGRPNQTRKSPDSFSFSLRIQQHAIPLQFLGFWLKPNAYKKEDWNWLIAKLEARMSHWSYKWLSRAGRLTLIKSVLLAIPVYWAALTWVPKGILEKIRRICSRFLWAGSKENTVLPWVAWEKVARPKDWGGWGIKSLPDFSVSLVAKSG
eukprot:PITA_06064